MLPAGGLVGVVGLGGCVRIFMVGVAGVLEAGGMARGGLLWRGGGEHGEGFAALFAGSGREPGGGSARVVGLTGVPGAEDALVADGVQAGEPECEWCEAHEAAPAAADGVGGRVFDGGEGAFGAGAPGVGAAVRCGWVVVFLLRFGCGGGWDGEGLLDRKSVV